MSTEKQTLHPQQITLARDYRGIKQDILAESLNIPQSQLSKIENGIKPVFCDEALAKKFCKILKFPLEFFLIRTNLYSLSTNTLYRKRQNVAITKILDAKLEITKHHLHSLIKNITITEWSIPTISVDESNSPEKIANKIRDYFGIKNTAVINISEILEDNGCIIYHDRFDNINGLTFYLQDRPIIYINDDYPVDRIRFTLSHELGHIVMHYKGIPTKEKEMEANSFASEFLMPSKLISKDFDNIDLNDLEEYANLKLKWKVSMQAIIRKAKDLGRLSENQYKNLQIKISRYGYRKQEPYQLDKSLESSNMLAEIFETYHNELNYNAEDMQKLLKMRKKDIIHFYDKYMPENLLNDIRKPKLYVVDKNE